jgi:hypothetical protein
VTDVRAELEQVMRGTLADAANWGYFAVRPEGVPTPARMWKKGTKVRADCSTGVRDVCWFCPPAPDPFFNGWGHYGNSQTLWLRLHHLDHASELEVGDIVVFGRDGRDHATMVLEPGPDPLLWSFGHPGAPNTYRLSWDHRPATFLKLPVVEPPPTPQDKLRAMTGFYSWVAWRLGEGPWKKYGTTNATVRPNVPRRIPAGWWTRYAQFLASRKHSLSQ